MEFAEIGGCVYSRKRLRWKLLAADDNRFGAHRDHPRRADRILGTSSTYRTGPWVQIDGRAFHKSSWLAVASGG